MKSSAQTAAASLSCEAAAASSADFWLAAGDPAGEAEADDEGGDHAAGGEPESVLFGGSVLVPALHDAHDTSFPHSMGPPALSNA
jgi:hypothetical protein